MNDRERIIFGKPFRSQSSEVRRSCATSCRGILSSHLTCSLCRFWRVLDLSLQCAISVQVTRELFALDFYFRAIYSVNVSDRSRQTCVGDVSRRAAEFYLRI